MDQSSRLQQQLEQALAKSQPVNITGGDSKAFYGREAAGEKLDVSGHTGIVDYDFKELVITARAGTPLETLKEVLSENHQHLPFDPPAYAANATLGGTMACGFSGPARPFAGSARDYILGCKVLNGRAEQLTLGGQVMKNVAGYDLSRLMVGSLGTLGVMLDVSLKVLPKPATEVTLTFDKPVVESLQEMNRLAGLNYPLSAAAWLEGRLYLRFSGFEDSVCKAVQQLGGEKLSQGVSFWQQLREHQLPFFDSDKVLWRLSVPPATPVLTLPGSMLYDWAGAQRWLLAEPDIAAGQIQAVTEAAGGHAMQFRHGTRDSEVFHRLSGPLMAIHQQLKQAMDPYHLLNPGRMYQGL